MIKILVVDDEPQLRRALTLNLTARGYGVVEAATGEAAIQVTANDHPDLVLLDLGLPGINGLGVIQALRGWTNVPIIVLTARDEERSKVDALNLGADDYVTKPFGMSELLARINASLRRAAPAALEADAEVVAGWLRLDLAAHRAFVGDHHEREVHLTGTEWQIVGFLVRNAGRLVTHSQLVTAVWGPGYPPNPNVLRAHMANIRRKLERLPATPVLFLTDTGVGYRFNTDARQES